MRVVVGWDGSVENDAALRFAAQNAHESDVELMVVAVYPDPHHRDGIEPGIGSWPGDAELRLQAHERTEEALRRALGPVSPQPLRQIVTQRGPGLRAVLQHSAEAIMVVVSCHDRTEIKELFDELGRRERADPQAAVPIALIPTKHDSGPPTPAENGSSRFLRKEGVGCWRGGPGGGGSAGR